MSAGPCRGPHRQDPPLTGQPLCDSCVQRFLDATDPRRALGLPALVRELHLRLAPGGGADRPRVSGTQERPLPIRADVYELTRQIEDVALSWAEVVADVVRIRPARNVDGALLLLHLHSWRLLEIQAWPMRRSVPFADDGTVTAGDDDLGLTMAGGALLIVELDGVDGAIELLDRRARARRLLGHVRSRTALPLPCPSCREQTLVLWAGSDTVDCDSDECAYRIAYGDYGRLVRNIVRMNRLDAPRVRAQ